MLPDIGNTALHISGNMYKISLSVNHDNHFANMDISIDNAHSATWQLQVLFVGMNYIPISSITPLKHNSWIKP